MLAFFHISKRLFQPSFPDSWCFVVKTTQGVVSWAVFLASEPQTRTSHSFFPPPLSVFRLTGLDTAAGQTQQGGGEVPTSNFQPTHAEECRLLESRDGLLPRNVHLSLSGLASLRNDGLAHGGLWVRAWGDGGVPL